jgi:catechol 2,3-dioxygenase-like lactoylglutathione lyase family enzyme
MLSSFDPVPVLAVSDLDRARAFYEGVLGFVPLEGEPEGVAYSSGSGRFLVYPSAYAGTNKATAMGFRVPPDAFDAEIALLRSRGVTFETFEAEGLSWTDGVASAEGMGRSAWIRDPDGNFLAVETSG